MKRNIIIFASLFIAALASCKKEGHENNEAPGEQRTSEIKGKTLVSTNIDGQITIQYTADKKISQMHKISPSGVEQQTTFTHEPGKSTYVVMKKINNDWVKEMSGIFTMVNGRATHYELQVYYPDGSLKTTLDEEFTYDNKGYLQKRKYDNGYFNIYNYDNDGNMTKLVYHTSNGTPVDAVEYTYGNIPEKFHQLSFRTTLAEGFFLPQLSKTLPVTQRGVKVATGTESYFYTFAYETDADGYVTKGIVTNPSAGASTEWINTYQ